MNKRFIKILLIFTFLFCFSFACVPEESAAENGTDSREPEQAENNAENGANSTENTEISGRQGEERANYADNGGDPNSPSEDEEDIEIPTKKTDFQRITDTILNTYVDEDGDVAYAALRRGRIDLLHATRELEDIHPAEYLSWERDEKIAFWINAYNILTLKLIVDNYPIEPRWYMIMYPEHCIMQIPGAWEKHFFEIMDLEYNLREIEREVLLERFGDPRIFFCLTYASKGGAFLRSEAYTANKLDKQLTQQTVRFITSPRGFKIDESENILWLADIFNWYEKAFADYERIRKFREYKPEVRSYLNFIYQYAPEEIRKYLDDADFQVRFMRYDWHLNDSTPVK